MALKDPIGRYRNNAPPTSAAARWTENLFKRTCAGDGSCEVMVHSMEVCRGFAPVSGKFLAQIYREKFRAQGIAADNTVFCDIEVYDAMSDQEKAGRIVFTYLWNPNTGQCDIPSLTVGLNDPAGAFQQALRQALTTKMALLIYACGCRSISIGRPSRTGSMNTQHGSI